MCEDEAQKAILNGIANGMEQEADSIANDEQKIRDTFEIIGEIPSEKKQEWLATTTAILRESIDYLRGKASWLRKNAMSDTL